MSSTREFLGQCVYIQVTLGFISRTWILTTEDMKSPANPKQPFDSHLEASATRTFGWIRPQGTKKTKIESKANYVRNEIAKQMRTASVPGPFLKHINFCLFAPVLLPWDFSHSYGILEAEVSLPQDSVSMETGESSGKCDYLRIDSYKRQLHQKQGQSRIHLANTGIANRFSGMMASICTIHVSDMKTGTVSL